MQFSHFKRKLFGFLVALLAPFALGAQLDVSRVMTIGRNALYFRDYMVAIGYFNKVLELRPWMAEPYFLRGYAKMMLEDYVGARQDATLALERNSFLGQAYLVRAIANHSLKSYEKASEDYTTALRLNPDDAGIRFNLAGTLYELEQYTAADSLAQEIPSQASVYSLSLLLRGDIALKEGDTLAANRLAELSIEADSTQAQAYAFVAELYRLQEKYPEAIKGLNKAIEYASDNSSLYINRGLMHYLNDNFVKAVEDYNQALLIDPSSIIARYNRALLRSSLGDLNNALEDFQAVLEREPTNDMARFNAGLLQSQLGDSRAATKQFTQIIDKYPDFLPAYIARSDARRQMGDLAGSDRDRYKAYTLQKNRSAQQGKERKKTKEKATRSEEEKTMEAYQSLIASEDRSLAKETTMPESLRGRVQDRTASVAPMGFHYLSFFVPEKYLSFCMFDARISDFNDRRIASDLLCSTAQIFSLDSTQTSHATEQLRKLDESVIQSPYYYLARGLYKYALVDLEEALRDFDRALELHHQFPLALFARATTRWRLQELSNASQESTKENKGSSEITSSIMGKPIGTQSPSPSAPSPSEKIPLDYREVVTDLDLLIKQYPDMPIALYNRALVAEKMGSKEEALAYYSQAASLSNAPAEVFFNRGLLYLSMGKKQEATKDLSLAGEKGLYQAYSILKRIQ